jgi:uncharacterized repeat protein (TIGR01451 family)
MNIMKLFGNKVVLAVASLLIATVALLPLVPATVNADCGNTNSIVDCGVDKTSLKNAIDHGDATQRAVYQHFGVDSNEVDAAQDGYVTKDGHVYINGNATAIASNVWTAGRQQLSANDQPIAGPAWMRPPAVSFRTNQLDAFVYAPGGVFQWAVLKECGNPVEAINAPFGQIYKRVRDITKDANTNYAADTSDTALAVSTGDTVRYEITVTNNGFAAMTGVHMFETAGLPQGVELISNPADRSVDVQEGTIQPDGSYLYTLTTKVTATTDGQLIDNKACFTADQNQSGCDHAWIKVTTTPTPTTCTTPGGCTPPPTCTTNCGTPPCTTNCTPTATASAQCAKVVQANLATSSYRFTATANITGNGLTVTNYIWNIYDKSGKKIDTKDTKTVNTLDYTFTAKGDYTVAVQVKTSDNNTTAEGAVCKLSFTAPGTTVTTAAVTSTPSTGAETPLAGMLGTGALGYVVQAYRRSKRSLVDAVRSVR